MNYGKLPKRILFVKSQHIILWNLLGLIIHPSDSFHYFQYERRSLTLNSIWMQLSCSVDKCQLSICIKSFWFIWIRFLSLDGIWRLMYTATVLIPSCGICRTFSVNSSCNLKVTFFIQNISIRSLVDYTKCVIYFIAIVESYGA